MATLNELKTQITNANALGREKITNKGGTVAQDADTVAIMGAIDSIPAGGGSAPTVVNEITWAGTGDPVETVIGTLYKITDSVLPYGVVLDIESEIFSNQYTYSTDISSGAVNTPCDMVEFGNNAVMFGVSDNGAVICATATVVLLEGTEITLPEVGTYGMKIDDKWLTRITATAAAGE